MQSANVFFEKDTMPAVVIFILLASTYTNFANAKPHPEPLLQAKELCEL